MKVLHLVVGAALVAIAYIVIRRKCWCTASSNKKEGYRSAVNENFPPLNNDGAPVAVRPGSCEEKCFDSQYYDACMNMCLQDGHADYAETGDEYDVLGVGQIDDLDRGYGYDTPGGYGPEYGLRGETPGH